MDSCVCVCVCRMVILCVALAIRETEKPEKEKRPRKFFLYVQRKHEHKLQRVCIGANAIRSRWPKNLLWATSPDTIPSSVLETEWKMLHDE